MNDGFSGSDKQFLDDIDDSSSLSTKEQETYGKMIHRHKLEIKKLQAETKTLLKKGKKDKKLRNSLEAIIYKMENDLNLRHLEEISANPCEATSNIDCTGNQANFSSENQDNISKDIIATKLLKAQRKRERRKERFKVQAVTVDEVAVDYRQLELDSIEKVLHKEGFSIKEILSDGDCMYHAIAYQLDFWGIGLECEKPHKVLRNLAANYMRNNSSTFIPFLVLEENSEQKREDLFDEYCNRVSSTSQWGTQCELLALSDALKSPIWIYLSSNPILKMGEHYQGNPLRLTYHKHYYALGNHYNSVQWIEEQK